MFWIKRWNSILSLLIGGGVLFFILGVFIGATDKSLPLMSSDMAISIGFLAVILGIVLRVLSKILDTIMTAFGKPLFYEIRESC